MPRKLTTKEFITKAIKIFGNKYDYSLVEYTGSKNKIKIICPYHNIFEQQPNSHLNGKGCIICANISKQLGTQKFIEKANLIHNNLFDYSLVEYKNNNGKIKIICSKHGIFKQSPNVHLRGCGCDKCFDDKTRLTTKEFIEKAQIVHNNKYDYSLVDYINSKTKIKIICLTHGEFLQLPNNHLFGSGCKKCSNQTSKGEKDVLKYIKTIYSGVILENDREQIKPYELDMYIPNLKIALEYNGKYWHDKREKNFPGYHRLKEDLCKKINIKLINISDIDWKNNSTNIKTKILSLIKCLEN